MPSFLILSPSEHLRNAPALQFALKIIKCTFLPLSLIDKSNAAPEQAPTQPAQSEKPKVSLDTVRSIRAND